MRGLLAAAAALLIVATAARAEPQEWMRPFVWVCYWGWSDMFPLDEEGLHMQVRVMNCGREDGGVMVKVQTRMFRRYWDGKEQKTEVVADWHDEDVRWYGRECGKPMTSTNAKDQPFEDAGRVKENGWWIP